MENEKTKVKYSGLLSEMAKYGHTQRTIGNLLNLSEAAISRRFSGEIKWTIPEVEIICKYYKKDYKELFVNGSE